MSADRLLGGGVSVLVGGAVFKTVERQSLSLVGSIPIRLRHRPDDQAWQDPVHGVLRLPAYSLREQPVRDGHRTGR